MAKPSVLDIANSTPGEPKGALSVLDIANSTPVVKKKKNLPPSPDRQPKNAILPYVPDVSSLAVQGPPVISGDIGSGRAIPTAADQGKSGRNPLTPAQIAQMQRAQQLAAGAMTGNPAAILQGVGPKVKPKAKALPPAPDRQPSMQPTAGDEFARRAAESQKEVEAYINSQRGIERPASELERIRNEGKQTFIRQYGFDPDKFPARAAQIQSQEFQRLVGDYIRPGMTAISNLVSPFPALNRTASDLGTMLASGAISAPVDMGFDAGVLVAPNSSLIDRVGAGVNIGINAGAINPAVPIGAAVKGARALKTAKKTGDVAADLLSNAMKGAEGGGIPKRKLADAPEFKFETTDAKPTFRPKEGIEPYIEKNWKQRTEGLINALSREIENAGSSQKQRVKKAEYKALRAKLRNSLQSGEVHPSIRAELTDKWNSQSKRTIEQAPKPASAPTAKAEPIPVAKREPTNVKPAPPKTRPVEPTKVVDETEGQGIAHADIDALRNEIGWEPRDKTVKRDTELMKGAKRLAGKEEQIAQTVLDNSKRTLTDDEGLALASRLKSLKEDMQAARAADDGDAFIFADDAAQKIANALDQSGTRQGRAFRARQFVALNEDSWALKRRLDKKVNDGVLEKAGPEAKQLQAAIKQIEDLEIQNRKLRESQVSEFVEKEKKASTKMTREELDLELDDLFKEFSQKIAKVSSGLDPDLLPIVGKIAVNRAKRLGLALEDTVASTIKYFKDKGQDVSREEVIEGIAQVSSKPSTPRTEAQKNLSKLKAEAKKITTMFKAGTAVPTKEARRLEQIAKKSAELEEILKNPQPKAPVDKKPKSALLEIEEAKLVAKRKAVRDAIENAGATKGTKIARKITAASTEAKLWNPVARAVDIASTAQEVATSIGAGPVDRAIANLAAKLLKTDVRFARVPFENKKILVDRFKIETRKQFETSKITDVSMYGGGGPATKLAGMLDSPGRAFHFLTFAGERAQDIAKKTGKSFEEVLDQIRNPETKGPLTQREALELFEQASDYSNVNMLTNANIASRAKHSATALINSAMPDTIKPLMHAINDITFQFGRVLVNVADKTGQYSNPVYAAFRGFYELLPNKKAIPIESRLKTFGQIARRGGLGAGMAHLGYQFYKDGGRTPEAGGVPMGSTIVRVYDKNGKKSGSVYQDDGYLSMVGGMTTAFMSGYRQAQIEDMTHLTKSQRDKMLTDLKFAPIKDNPLMGNVTRYMKAIDSGKPGDTVWSILTGLYFPGGLREWKEVQDKQQGVFSRRASGPVEIAKSRMPYMKDQLKIKGRPELKP